MRNHITGNEAVVLAAIDAGAKLMFGYPITPATEILEGWIKYANESKKVGYIQTEDEIAAGFCVNGAVLAGKIAFTASAGPGHILLQDSLSMAENMRLPYVAIVMQRGGPSTGTVNFSQQEVNLAAFGGNGDGYRVVYSASSVRELYDLTYKSFQTAWKYRFPTILLGDGYLAKMSTDLAIPRKNKTVSATKIFDTEHPVNLRNCFSTEESFGEYLSDHEAAWRKFAPKIAESEKFFVDESKYLIVAHGLVAAAAKETIVKYGKTDHIGLFRPITLNPFDQVALRDAVVGKKKIFVIESAKNQLSHIVKYALSGLKIEIIEISKPAQGFTSEEIITKIRKHNG
ncbi:MAG: ferredoxin oxidoreductase [Candidatus Berkelbacteria bacterium]